MGMPSPSLPPRPPEPQMPAVAPPAMPKVEAPKLAAPTVATPGGQPSNILLILIFCVLAFLAGGVVVYLLMKH